MTAGEGSCQLFFRFACSAAYSRVLRLQTDNATELACTYLPFCVVGSYHVKWELFIITNVATK